MQRYTPARIEFVKGAYPKEGVEQLIFNNITSSTSPDINIYPVRDRDDSTRVIYLVEVAQGDNPPYQAADGKYHRRLNATKYPMSHSEIADFFLRRRRPKLVLHCQVVKILGTGSFNLQISVSNLGTAVAKSARAIVSFEDLEIIEVERGPSNRIDELRNGIPTLQWDNPIGVVYQSSQKVSADVIWDLTLKLKRTDKLGLLSWETIAEDMEPLEGKCVVLPLPA